MISFLGVGVVSAILAAIVGVAVSVVVDLLMRLLKVSPESGLRKVMWWVAFLGTWALVRDPMVHGLVRWERKDITAEIMATIPPPTDVSEQPTDPADKKLVEMNNLDLVVQAVIKEDSKAKYHLANRMAQGIGGYEVDPVKARKLWMEAAQQGHPEAQFNLAYYCMKGMGGPANPVEAATWFRKSADQGNPRAQFWMGNCYENGIGVQKDMVEACRWFKLGAEKNHRECQGTMGFRYGMGEGVSKDLTQSFEWFWCAAQNGDAPSINAIPALMKDMTASQLKEALPKAKALYASLKGTKA